LKRLPLICSVAAVAALSASLAYWGLQLFKPKQRPIAPPPAAQAAEVNVDAARGLFGGQTAVAQVSNYQLRGVVAAANGRGSAAIISADAQPAKAYGVGAEVAPGVTVKDVQPRFVTLLEGGIQKRIDLAVDEGSAASGVQPVQPLVPPTVPPPVPPPVPVPMPQPAPAPGPAAGQGVNLPPAVQQPGGAAPVPAPVPGTIQGPPAQMAPAQPVTANPGR
jgi:general secretion pathway protein C